MARDAATASALLGETLDEERQADEKLHALGKRLAQRAPMPA